LVGLRKFRTELSFKIWALRRATVQKYNTLILISEVHDAMARRFRVSVIQFPIFSAKRSSSTSTRNP
jgi:hypothetical protein